MIEKFLSILKVAGCIAVNIFPRIYCIIHTFVLLELFIDIDIDRYRYRYRSLISSCTDTTAASSCLAIVKIIRIRSVMYVARSLPSHRSEVLQRILGKFTEHTSAVHLVTRTRRGLLISYVQLAQMACATG